MPSAQTDKSDLALSILLALFGTFAVLIEAAPLGFTPGARPSPDLLFCIVAYWAVRRPAATPLLLVVALGLLRDFLTDVPIGAGALTLAIAAEVLRGMSGRISRLSVVMEWVISALVAAAMLLLQWTMVLVTLMQPPYLAEIVSQWLATALFIPVVALSLRWFLRIGRTTPPRHRPRNRPGEAG